MAVGSEEWGNLPAGSKASVVRDLLPSVDYWAHPDRLVRLLRSFSDAVHLLEGDKPHLAECHVVLLELREHAVQWAVKHRDAGLADSALCLVTDNAVPTIDRRLELQPGGALALVYNPAYFAAFAVDPFFVEVEDDRHCCAQMLSGPHMEAARKLVERMSGAVAAGQFVRLFSRPHDRTTVPTSKEQVVTWRKFGDAVPDLRETAVRLLCAHATSAASERNWSLWGRVYCGARSSRGMMRAEALVAICI